ncbi:OsmC family protein [Fulvimarina sp. MAC8]|uniref:OsmC family protein n=1 Tax=Fulvimarina sp. MAC8 TaxID=3162874 RepID=UPI0032EB3D9E
MVTSSAVIEWQRSDAGFLERRYSRAHEWRFDGGVVVPASSSPEIVPSPYSNRANVDPEEAFVASLASCHMLWFLELAARAGVRVDRYTDEASCLLETRQDKTQWISRVVLRPHTILDASTGFSQSDLDALHEKAHHACFLANSVKCEIITEATFELAGDE